MTEEPEGSGRRREALGMHACSTLASSITQPTVDPGSREGEKAEKGVCCYAGICVDFLISGKKQLKRTGPFGLLSV